MKSRTLPALSAACLLMACNANSSPAHPHADAHTVAAGASMPAVKESPRALRQGADCLVDGTASERVACVVSSSKESVRDCDGVSQGRCSQYLELGKLEHGLVEAEQALISAGTLAVQDNEVQQPGYARQLAQASTREFAAWRSFRDAACEAAAYYDGFMPASMDAPVIGCLIEETKKRTSELTALSSALGK